MKKILTFITIWLLGTSVFGQQVDFNKGSFKEKDYFIELPYKKIKDKIIVEVKIEDETVRFILDTGAPTAVRNGLFEKMQFDILASEDISDINGNISTFRIVSIPELKLGHVAVINTPAVVFKENLLTECFEVDGIIGSNLLRESVIQFDDRTSLVRIANSPDKLDLKNTIQSEMILDQQQSSPIFKIELDEGVTEMVLFDTGADELYAMSNTNMKKLKKTKTFNKISESKGATTVGLNGLEQTSKSYRLSIPKMIIQGMTLQNLQSETTTDVNSRVGVRFLEHGVVTIDYRNGQSYLKPYPQDSVSKVDFWDISPTFMEGKLVVGRIWKKKLRKKVSVGDRIIRINNINTENMSDCDYLLNNPLLNIQRATITIVNSKGIEGTFKI